MWNKDSVGILTWKALIICSDTEYDCDLHRSENLSEVEFKSKGPVYSENFKGMYTFKARSR